MNCRGEIDVWGDVDRNDDYGADGVVIKMPIRCQSTLINWVRLAGLAKEELAGRRLVQKKEIRSG